MILGTDISSHQGSVDFAKMKAAGASFVICRKQIGYYGDARFFEYMEGAKDAELAFGAYGVPFPGYDMQRQYAKFIEGIKPSDLDFPPEADVEKRHKLTKSKAIGDVLGYMHRMKDWWGYCVPYTAKFVWEEMYSTAKGWIDDWDLHVANYTTYHQPYYIPIGWGYRKDGTLVPVQDSFVIWQYSADGNGRGREFGVSSDDIDLNWMKEEYYNMWTNGGTTPPVLHKAALDVPKEADTIELTMRRV